MIVKIIHMISAVLVLLVFALRAAGLWRAQPWPVGLDKTLRILTHVAYLGVVVCGLLLLMRLPGLYPHWVIAKLVLFAVALSASIKAFRATTPRPQARAGALVALLAYALIVGLVVVKPGGVYGQPRPPVVASSS